MTNLQSMYEQITVQLLKEELNFEDLIAFYTAISSAVDAQELNTVFNKLLSVIEQKDMVYAFDIFYYEMRGLMTNG